MAEPDFTQHGVHLVGSVPLDSNTAVFSLTSKLLGRYLRRLPDGETGVRSNWIAWQQPILSGLPQLEQAGASGGLYGEYPLLSLRAGVAAEDIRFPPLGYSAAAIASYAEFMRLKREGIIPPPVRFQVCLPTPLAPVHLFVDPEDGPIVEAAYEARMLTELEEILAAIPAQDLAIQWDTAVEFAVLENVMATYLTDPQDEILSRLVRLGNQVPAEVELGYHLCYGDAGHKHFKEPDDMSKLVTIATGIGTRLARSLTWIHMPVPRSRTDQAYFVPLRELTLDATTELYLGLVHWTDGVAGTQQRLRAARAIVTDFGVATECGLGRRPAETIAEVLQVHAGVAEPLR